MALISENSKLNVFTLLTVSFTIIFLYVRRIYSYWDRKGFKTLSNFNYLVGHFKNAFLQNEFFGETVNKLYKSTNEPFIGIYSIFRPILLVRDPELIRSILIKDFSHFTDRGIHCNEDYDPLSGNLVALPGQKWKRLRGKLTPTFTSGKLKAMFSTLVDCGASLQNHLEKLARNGEPLDVREISASHATNIIASVAFGIEVDTITNPDNDFRKYGRKIFEVTIWKSVKSLIAFVAPRMMTMLRLKSVDSDVEHFVKSVVKQSLEYREQSKVIRKDFFQLLVQLRNNGTVQLDDEWETVIKADKNQKTLTLNEISAQTFVFFAAGFETSSTTLSFCLYELAKNPEIQEKVYNEIKRTLEQNGGQITYEAVSSMNYLEACIDETLRKYSIAPMLTRTCVKDYEIPGTNKVIEKGVEVFVPVFAIQRDPQYYEDPENFDPKRFNEENLAGKNQLNRPYLPFGDGPRNCIGMRMGKMQTKVGLIMMLQKHKFELGSHQKCQDMEFDAKAFLLAPLGKIWLRVSKR